MSSFFTYLSLLDFSFPFYTCVLAPRGPVYLSVGLSDPVPALAKGGNDDIERFSCYYVG